MSTDRTTEILNYLTAITRDIGEFRAETKSRFDGLETRVGALERHFDVLAAHVEKLDARMERFDARMERFDARMERFEIGLDDVRRSVRQLHHKFEGNSEEMMDLRSDSRDLRKRVEIIEKKVGITDDL